MEDEFDILTAKVLAGEASAEEQAHLMALLSASAERQEEYDGLKAAWHSLKTAAPIARALDAPPAEIPAQRLRQLQQVVRERANAASSSETSLGKSTAPGRSERPFTPALSPAAGNEGTIKSFWRWFHGRAGVSPASFSAAVVILLCAVCAAFWLVQSRKESMPEITSSETVAYVLASQGAAEIVRSGKRVSAADGLSLRQTDELWLGSRAQATLLTRTGAVAIAGPLRAAASSLVPAVGPPGSDAKLDKFQIALFRPASELLNAGLLVAARDSRSIPVYCPVGATANLTPLILWQNQPSKTYDLLITDEFDAKTPAWRVSGVTSPVEFAGVAAWKTRPLAKDGLYRLRLNESGRPLTANETTFRTTGDATSLPLPGSVVPLAEAAQILSSEPVRAGDALALLLRLPANQANTELALRLVLLLFGQLGYAEDFEAALARLQTAR